MFKALKVFRLDVQSSCFCPGQMPLKDLVAFLEPLGQGPHPSQDGVLILRCLLPFGRER